VVSSSRFAESFLSDCLYSKDGIDGVRPSGLPSLWWEHGRSVWSGISGWYQNGRTEPSITLPF
jgi:hypothetical protein